MGPKYLLLTKQRQLCHSKNVSGNQPQEAKRNVTNIQLYLAIGVPILFNGLLFISGFTMLLTKVNHLETKFDANFNLLVGS